jgi:hypothetical protein
MMSKLRVPCTEECCSLKRAAKRKTEGHLIVCRTNLPLRKSLSTFFHAAAPSAVVISLRKTPSLNAFRTSNTCKGVKANIAPLSSKYALA